MGISRESRTAKIFGYPILSQELVKLRTLNFVHTFIGSITIKAHEKMGKVAVGIVRESPKFLGAGTHMGRIVRSSLKPLLSLASIEDAACIRDPASCDSWSVGLFDVSCFMRGCSVFLYTFCVYSRKLVHVQ